MNRVTLFTRPECTLCRSAAYVIQRVRRRVPFQFDMIDISAAGNHDWLVRYADHIPVVHLNGREIARHRIDEKMLAQVLIESNAEN